MTTTAMRREVLSDEQLKRRTQNEKRLIYAFVILFVIAPIVWNLWTNHVALSEVEVVGSSELCPGDLLRFRYHLQTRGRGVFVRDLTTWRISPPKTMIFSEPRRFIIDEAIEQDLVESWEVPDVYFNYETWSEDPIQPGQYRRYISVISPSKSTVEDIESVDFTILEKEKCLHAASTKSSE